MTAETISLDGKVGEAKTSSLFHGFFMLGTMAALSIVMAVSGAAKGSEANMKRIAGDEILGGNGISERIVADTQSLLLKHAVETPASIRLVKSDEPESSHALIGGSTCKVVMSIYASSGRSTFEGSLFKFARKHVDVKNPKLQDWAKGGEYKELVLEFVGLHELGHCLSSKKAVVESNRLVGRDRLVLNGALAHTETAWRWLSEMKADAYAAGKMMEKAQGCLNDECKTKDVLKMIAFYRQSKESHPELSWDSKASYAFSPEDSHRTSAVIFELLGNWNLYSNMTAEDRAESVANKVFAQELKQYDWLRTAVRNDMAKSNRSEAINIFDVWLNGIPRDEALVSANAEVAFGVKKWFKAS